MNGRWPKEDTGILDQMRQQRGTNRFFGSSLMQDMINNDNMADMSMSPDTGTSSDRPTPNSSTSASDRQHQTSNSSNSNTRGASVRNSFEASPGLSAAQQHQNLSAIFGDMANAVGEIPTGLTPGRQYGGGAPETPKEAAGVTDGTAGDFSWDNFGGGGAGLTPMSEGVLRTMLQMGPMETMDMSWDNPP